MSEDVTSTITDISPNPKVRHITPLKEELQSIPFAYYICQICGIKVKTQSNLRAHCIKTHGLVKDAKDVAFLLRRKTDISDIFHCPVPTCKYTEAGGAGFSKFWHLKQHYQLVHMKKSYECSTCLLRFSTPSAQAYHSKTCGTKFECPVCRRKYKAKKFLNQHARRTGHDLKNGTPNIQSPCSSSSSSVPSQFHQIDLMNSVTTNLSSSQETIAQTSNTTVADNSIQPTNIAILPLLILPLNVSGGFDQAALSAATNSLMGQVMSHLRSGLTVLPAVSNVQAQPAVYTQASVYPESRNVSGSSLVPVADVGTTTMRLSHAHTQTEVVLPPDCPPLPMQTVPGFGVFYGDQRDAGQAQHTREVYAATSPHPVEFTLSVGSSPPPQAYLTDMSHSIELQYPEMNSNGTMTNYHNQMQQQQQHNAFQQTAAIATSSAAAATGASAYMTSVGGPANSCYEVFANDNSTGSSGVPVSSSSSYNPSSNEWRCLRRDTEVEGTSASLRANSVAVETTLDLADFDPSNSGNCYWPTAESFAHMQTQTVLGPDELEAWFTNVQTQTSVDTASRATQQQPSWASSFANTDAGVCVGVNTEMLLTPEHGNNS